MKRRRSRRVPVIPEPAAAVRKEVRLFSAVAHSAVGQSPVVPSLPGDPGSPTDEKRRFRALLNLQHWLWGCDVRHATGNRLLQQGLRRIQPPPGCRSPSVYLQHLPGGRTVILRGFGTVISETGTGAVFLPRHLPFPEWMPEFDTTVESGRLPFVPDQLPPRIRPSGPETAAVRTLVVHLLRWIADWEQTALSQLGASDRDRSILNWAPEGRDFPAATLPETWRRLAGRLEAAPSGSLAWFDLHEGVSHAWSEVA